jgi:hypothetical protein
MKFIYAVLVLSGTMLFAQEPAPPNISMPHGPDPFSREAGPKIGMFLQSEIRFDESVGPQKPTPKVPKSWRFVGVTNGAKSNVTQLWFEGTDGTIYMLKGFVTDASTSFVLDREAFVLGRE